MLGANMSLMGRSVQLLRRVEIEGKPTLVGGILRWGHIAQAISEGPRMEVNVPQGELPQYTAAIGCAVLRHIHLRAPK